MERLSVARGERWHAACSSLAAKPFLAHPGIVGRSKKYWIPPLHARHFPQLKSVALLAVVWVALPCGCSDQGRGPAGCKPGLPAGPATCVEPPLSTPPVDVPAVEVPLTDVGPSPLRRLSNHEYLYALQDLFPDQHPTLPELPSDGEVGGFDNAADGQTPSDVRVARYEAAANVYAAGATSDPAALQTLLGCDYDTPESASACGESFVSTIGRRLFRRPLESSERERFVLRFQRWSRALDFPAAVQLTLSAMLQSPQFLYRPEILSRETTTAALVAVEPFALASRLSFLLWASVPDEALLEAAEHGELTSVEQVRAQGVRMLQDPRAARVYWDFHRQWLGLDRILDAEHNVRTPEVDPLWSPLRQRAIHRESQLFVEHVMLEGGSLRDLLLSRRAWLDSELMDLYGLSVPFPLAADTPQEQLLPERERAGILTRAAFLAAYSHRGATSPPIRANALELRLLCRTPRPPPPGIDTRPPAAEADAGAQTNRMLFEARTSPAACRGCHLGLNGIGFGFENFNAAGKLSTLDHGLPIDSTGHLYGTDVDGDFSGAVALSEALSHSADAHRCAAQQWLRYAFGRPLVDGESKLVDALTAQLMADGSSVRDLLLGIITSSSFRYQHARGT